MTTLMKNTNLAVVPELVRLDLGCGSNIREGFTGVDLTKTLEGVIVHDLRVTPWPWESDSVDEAHSSHFIEHLTGEEFMVFMNELHRVMKPEAKATLIAPYYASMRAWQDPTHKQAINEAKFLYFNKEWRAQNKLSHYPITTDFDYSYGYNISNPRWLNAASEARQHAISHYINVVDDLIVTLTKRSI